MDNEYNFDIEVIRSLPDNSIMDTDLILQISLYGIKYNDNSLYIKIKKEFQFAGLYPHIMKVYDINIDNPILKEILNKRDKK